MMQTMEMGYGATGRGRNIWLWALQGLLAALFLFTGVSKFIMPPEVLTQGTTLSVGFIRFVGAMEILGAFGLILPGLFRIARWLTPLAAGGLLAIVIGATIVTAMGPQAAMTPIPLVTAILVAIVLWGRRQEGRELR
ncbi:MAG TPA: DoxX family protein [Bryobacteraceae bacterium]|nr:DoxX family protein [Bryobacteraceae bacterium]